MYGGLLLAASGRKPPKPPMYPHLPNPTACPVPATDLRSAHSFLTNESADEPSLKYRYPRAGLEMVSDWPAALSDVRRYLEKLGGDVRALVKAGKPITAAADTAAGSERSRWDLFHDYTARNATAAFSEIEWE